ncbi:hypothetical protein M0D21_18075 [Aquimarina sp. D1M17]|uniref:hypothetical protein n=1 Tax=Aquimarina acroporae TaxID=2937283 RepID=UPI0020BFBC1D|nr:hypothetical protein [Aquimarina acroporae]MCK8523496.1 hypothetical protein [Aquimarina acroporae]
MMKKTLLSIIIIFSIQNTFAHQDFWMIKDYGNIKVRIKTGYQYEEINKVFIYGQLAEKLAIELGYKDQIFLDFNHHYTGECESDYFISYDKGAIEYTWNGSTDQKSLLRNKSIVIRQVSRKFNAETTLKLVEYAIQNLPEIKSNQNYIVYNENYCQWKIQTIDMMKIKQSVEESTSQEIKSIMSTRIERPDKDFKFGYTYYWQNDKYLIIDRDVYGKERIVKEFEELYDFKKVGNCTFVFTSISDFYTVNKTYGRRPEIISKKWTINNAELNYRPYKLEHLGGYKYSIYFSYNSNEEGWQPKPSTLIYDETTDELIKL